MPERAIPIALCATAWTAAASTIVANPPLEEDIRLFGLTAGMAAFVWLRTSSPNLTRLGTYMYAKAVHDMTKKDGRRGNGGASGGLGAMAIVLTAASVLMAIAAPPPKAAELDRPRTAQRPGPEVPVSTIAPRTERGGRPPAGTPPNEAGEASGRTTPLTPAASASATRWRPLPPPQGSRTDGDSGPQPDPRTDSGTDAPAPRPKSTAPADAPAEPGLKPTLTALLGIVPQVTGKLDRTPCRNDP